MNPKIIFLGNTKYSQIDAQIISDKFGLSAVVTINDRPKGRNRTLTPNPAKVFAQEKKINLITADKLDDKVISKIAFLEPDFLVVADYGLILPQKLLDIPKFAPLNVHHSLLPKYRGPSPAPSAILAGEKVSGVTIIEMTADVDAGDIYAQKEYKLKEDETTDSLLTTLNTLGGELVVEVISNLFPRHSGLSRIKTPADSGVTSFPRMTEGARFFYPPKRQDQSQATYTERFTKVDGKIDLESPPDPEKLDRMIRAFFPWPTVWCEVKVEGGKTLKLKFLPSTINHEPPTKYLIQPEGKRVMSLTEFKNGYPEIFTKLIKLTIPELP